MHAAPTLSVIVPLYRVERYLDDCLDSILRETSIDLEAVLIDDGSPDRSGRIAQARASRDARIVVLHQPNRGVSRARSAGIARARGRYLAFVDPDDIVPPGALARAVRTLEASGSDALIAAYARLRPTATGGYSVSPVQPWVSRVHAVPRLGIAPRDHPDIVGNVLACSRVVRRSAWTRMGLAFPPDRIYEDQILSAALYARAERIDVVPDVLLEWRERADGSSTTQNERDTDTLLACLRSMRDSLAILDTEAAPLLAQTRRRQMLERDVPRLLAQSRGGSHGRAAVSAFADSLLDFLSGGAQAEHTVEPALSR